MGNMKQYLDTTEIEEMFYQLSDDDQDDVSDEECKALISKLRKAIKQDAGSLNCPKSDLLHQTRQV